MTVNVRIIGAAVGVTSGQFNSSSVTTCKTFGMTDLCMKELKGWGGGARKEEVMSAFILHINENSLWPQYMKICKHVPFIILSYNSGFLYGLTAKRWINLSLQNNNNHHTVHRTHKYVRHEIRVWLFPAVFQVPEGNTMIGIKI